MLSITNFDSMKDNYTINFIVNTKLIVDSHYFEEFISKFEDIIN
jgi:hypothetical protein